jgi:hypothetical protein
MSPSTELVTGLLSASLPAAALANAARAAGAIWEAGRKVGADLVVDGLLSLALADGLPPQATIISSGRRTSAPDAACLNATRAAGAEQDALAPSLFASLAVAEMLHLTARQFLEAFAIGAEVSRRLAGALASAEARSFIPAGAVGQFGATLSVCRAVNLDRITAASALGLAAVQVTGNAQPGTAAYRLSVGNAARVGVEAAWIAKFGANGPQNGVVVLGLMIGTPEIEALIADVGEGWRGGSATEISAAINMLPQELRELLAA